MYASISHRVAARVGQSAELDLADFPDSLHCHRFCRRLPDHHIDDVAFHISGRTVELLAFLRNAKIGSNALAIAQIFLLGAAGVIWK